PMLEDAREWLRSQSGEHDRDYLSASTMLAALKVAFDDYEAGAMLYVDVIRHQDPQRDRDLTASALNSLVELFRLLGKPEEALKYHRQSLRIRLKLFGDAHIAIATALNNLGNVYSSFEKDDPQNLDRAKYFYRESYRMRQALLKAPHHHLAN